MPLRGFTLAEVLITLGIIGVVAALTIPTLISNNKKHVAESRLKEIVSTLKQAATMVDVDYGLNFKRELFEPNNPDEALDMFNKYYAPYIKFVEIKKGTKGVFGTLVNGSAIYFIKPSQPSNETSWGGVYIIACVTSKDCDEIDEDNGSAVFLVNNNSDNVHRFLLYSKGDLAYWLINGNTHEQLVSKCRGGSGNQQAEYCTALIFESGFKIPDDYPHKF